MGTSALDSTATTVTVRGSINAMPLASSTARVSVTGVYCNAWSPRSRSLTTEADQSTRRDPSAVVSGTVVE